MEMYLNFIVCLAFFATAFSQIYPGSYNVSSNAISVNGSSAAGHCSNVVDSGRLCNSPRSSVLFDGIPTLTELDGDMWARQLLTFNTSTSPARITFNFSTIRDINGPTVYTGVSMIEVILLNCLTREEAGIGNIAVSAEGNIINTIQVNKNLASCNHLVKVCQNNLHTTSPTITLSFNNLHRLIYIAEVSFYSDRSHKCSSVGLIETTEKTTPSSELAPETQQLQTNGSYKNFSTEASGASSFTGCSMEFPENKSNFKIMAVGVIVSFVFGAIFGVLGTYLVHGVYKKLHTIKTKKSPKHVRNAKMQNPLTVTSEAGTYEDVESLKEFTVIQNNLSIGKPVKMLHLPVSVTGYENVTETSISRYELPLQKNSAYGQLPI